MKKLLSLPPNLVSCFHDVAEVSRDEYFCTSDPIGSKLGSGGGTNWLLSAAFQEEALTPNPSALSSNLSALSPNPSALAFPEWLSREKRILLHAGGQSRRLPSYAPSGKVLTPIPVFRWSRGQRIDQNLLQLQMPLYEKIMKQAPDCYHTLIASGDVYIRAGKLQPIPEADVVCYGLWVDPSLAKNHGVFVSRRETPDVLDFVLQKPSVQRLADILHTHLFLMDIGIWLLSDRAVQILMKRSTNPDGSIRNYDLYSDFGCCLGQNPTIQDSLFDDLRVAILPLNGGQFYHYGTSREMISSTVAIQNLVYDQRAIIHLGVKPHPSIFIQNSHKEITLTAENENTWVENSWIGLRWHLSSCNIITGVPQNDWEVTLPKGVCVDVVPIGDTQWVLRPYGFNDSMRGDLHDAKTTFMGMPVTQWLQDHGLNADDIQGNTDLQSACIFPVCDTIEELGKALLWMLGTPAASGDSSLPSGGGLGRRAISANSISDLANLRRLQQQRLSFRRENLSELALNHRSSVFYQTNLDNMAQQFHRLGVPVPQPLPQTESLMKRISDSMFRSQLLSLRGEGGAEEAAQAFALLRDGLTEQTISHRYNPHRAVFSDQIVWGRSPVRIDIAGGWTDTPPYSLLTGGNVVNFAIELNGQPPLQTFIKPCSEPKIIIRSIDLGAQEVVTTWQELELCNTVGSPFSIPKAALCLVGLSPRFCSQHYNSLQEQLQQFGCGIELTMLSAIPAGSGLGTSSILASTVLGALSDFCGLGWDKAEICNRTLVLEQILTTGGGWQDQYGGVLPGIKLLRTHSGFEQTPEVRYLNHSLFTSPEFAPCHLLYYTGITRTAKKILAEIVRGMFLYDTQRLQLLDEMKEHAMDLYKAILRNDFQETGRLIAKTWEQNKLLDSGTCPPVVQSIISLVADYCLALKLPGAGGGGYLYMIAKDPVAALRIREILTQNPPNDRARFVEMTLSDNGLQVSRS